MMEFGVSSQLVQINSFEDNPVRDPLSSWEATTILLNNSDHIAGVYIFVEFVSSKWDHNGMLEIVEYLEVVSFYKFL